ARDRAAADGVCVELEAGGTDRRERLLELGDEDAGEDEVLLARHAHVASDSLRELRERDQLVAGDQADVHRDADAEQPFFFLRAHAEVVRVRRRMWRKLEVRERVPEPALHLGAHPLRAVVVNHELDPRLDARDAVAEVLLPRVEQGAQDRKRLVLADEDAELAAEPGYGGEPAADEDGETLLAAVDRPDERNAVDLRRVAPVRARRDRDLVLARQVRVVRVAVEEARHLVDHRRDVEQLVVRDPGDRTARDVPHGVAAGTGRRETHLGEPVEDLRERRQLEVVELDRLARRELALAAAVLVGELADRAQLLAGDAAGRELDAEHEGPDLGLVVVQPPPLEPDDVLLGDVRVARSDQVGQLVDDSERRLLELQALDRVALQHEVARGRIGECGATGWELRCHRLLGAVRGSSLGTQASKQDYRMYSNVT